MNKLNKVVLKKGEKRGKKTIAKERMYRHIFKEITTIHPNFNTGVSTGFRNYDYPHWESPYEHWCFVPNEKV